MAAKSTRKSSHGGRRVGAGRKSKATKALREDFALQVHGLIGEMLPDLVDNLKRLADGVRVEDAEGHVYATPPDREANKYLIDRLIGRPKQAVEHSGRDGGAIPITVYLPDNGRSPEPGDQAQLPAPGDVPGDAG